MDPLVRFPFHGYSNHLHNHGFEQTREQMKFVQNKTTLVYYNSVYYNPDMHTITTDNMLLFVDMIHSFGLGFTLHLCKE